MTILKPSRRAALAGLAAASVFSPAILRAQGSGWPKSGTIRLVIPFPPAGATDVIGRIVAEKLGQIWGTQVIIENKGGAGGNIGTDQVAKAAPDGNTFLIVSVGMATNPYLYKTLSYDPVKDFEPVSLLAMVPNIMITPPNHPAKTVAEFVAMAKKDPGKMSFGSSGIGTSVHLSGELFNKLTGAKMVHVPYRGTAEAKNDLMAGRLDCIFDNITAALPQARGGQVKALGITTAKRSALAPELAPVNDTVPGFDVSSWFAFFAPAKTPKDIITKMHADTKTALADAVVADKLGKLGAEIVGSSPAELAAFLKAESDKWGSLIKEIGITAG
ncbi:MAG: tripartite tricarboxylate transporter substrate binding protein [Beijerinckiaceae bacterium]|jgi:tripartite-type tricarboxylate transporter receptor subunit TctC|nr:tripartite tricarboxylate transporter substrate binding protein [Beijerinckiaceae bacterium]